MRSDWRSGIRDSGGDIMKKKWISIAALAILSCLCVKYSDSILALLPVLLDTIFPLILGFVIAYVLDILLKKLEKIYFPKRKDKWVRKTRRPVCVFISIALVLLIVVVLISFVVPALRDAVLVLTRDIPKAFTRFQKWLVVVAGDAGFVELKDFVASLEIDWNSISEKVSKFLSTGIGSLFNSAFSMANFVVSFAYTGVISLIFAIYMLFSKEKLQRQIRKVAAVYIPKRWYTKAEQFLQLAHETFTNFISGQLTESCILGVLCMTGMFILRLPYAVMTGMIVGVTALIPVMGAYIGAIIGAFVIVTVSPLKALIFLIFLVILQQVEGNLIYPRVVGGSIGLPGIWVLAAVTVGGGLLGIPGMMIGVPLTATIYKWLRNDVNERTQENRVVPEPHLFEETVDSSQT